MIDASAFQLLLTLLTRWLDRQEREVLRYLLEENRVLRRQLRGRRLQLTDDDWRRLAVRVYPLGRGRLREIATVVTPDTLLRWDRQLIAREWSYARRCPSRCGVLTEIRPIDFASRRVYILGSTPHPHELFIRQVSRTLTTADDGLPRAHRVLICDRDAKWSGEVRRLLSDGGIRVVQTRRRAPNANAHAERFVRSIKHECLDRIIPLGERHFQQTVSEYVVHYHQERNPQGLGNKLIEGIVPNRRQGRIRRRPRLGGLLNYYERAA